MMATMPPPVTTPVAIAQISINTLARCRHGVWLGKKIFPRRPINRLFLFVVIKFKTQECIGPGWLCLVAAQMLLPMRPPIPASHKTQSRFHRATTQITATASNTSSQRFPECNQMLATSLASSMTARTRAATAKTPTPRVASNMAARSSRPKIMSSLPAAGDISGARACGEFPDGVTVVVIIPECKFPPSILNY